MAVLGLRDTVDHPFLEVARFANFRPGQTTFFLGDLTGKRLIFLEDSGGCNGVGENLVD